MHEDSALGVKSRWTRLTDGSRNFVHYPDRCGVFVAKGELRSVVKNQDRKTLHCGEPISRGGKVTSQNVGFADPLIAKETIGSLRVGPVLASPRRSRAYFTRQLLQQLSQSLAVADILKLASHHLIVYPCIRSCLIRCSPTLDTFQHRSLAHGFHCAMTHLSM